jgi:hypothetical protein
MEIVRTKFTIALMTALVLSAAAGCGSPDLPGPVANSESAKAIRDVMKTGGDDGATTATAATGTGWATLKGRFVFVGTPPQRLPYNVDKDHNICTEGGRAPLQEKLIVQDGTNGIMNVAVYLRRATRVHESFQQVTEPVVLDQKVCVFLPHIVAPLAGKPMLIKNSDPTGHNAKFGSFNETVGSGGAREYTAPKEIALPEGISCSIHPWMKAYILPRENPYVAITKEDGSFELANLPAGEDLEFQVWHESSAGASQALVPNTPETKELNWSSRGRFKIKMQPDEVKEIQITVPATAFTGV